MTNRMDVLSARESNGKTYWTRLGVAFEAKDGNGWNVLLDVMPAPQEGQFKLMLRPPREDGEQPRKPAVGSQRHAPSFDSDDGPIPF